MALTKINRKPTDAEDTIRLKDAANVEWLTRVEWRDATPLGEEGPDTPNLVIHVMDAEGKNPISHSRVLTEFELSQDNFDPEALVASLTTELVDKKSKINKNRDKLMAFRNKIKEDKPINLNKENK